MPVTSGIQRSSQPWERVQSRVGLFEMVTIRPIWSEIRSIYCYITGHSLQIKGQAVIRVTGNPARVTLVGTLHTPGILFLAYAVRPLMLFIAILVF